MFGAFLIQVFTRYVLNDPLGWTSEVSTIAFLVVAFWGAGLMVRERDQVHFDLLFQSAPNSVRRVMSIVSSTAIAGIFLYALPANVDFVSFMAEDKTWVLEIPFSYVFSVFIVFIVGTSIRLLWHALKIFRADKDVPL